MMILTMQLGLVQRGLANGGSALLLGCVALLGEAPASANGAGARPQAPARPDSHVVRILFVGNSLTGVNDVPAVVQAMAATAGKKLVCESHIMGGANLEDQWGDPACRRALTGAKWDYLVLQQGPSSLPESQVDLRKWAITWANEARRVGAKPALYMVWPFKGQKSGFALVSLSYRNAALASKSVLLPAGDAWADASARSPDLPLYQADRLHPTESGTYLAALVITSRLTGVPPRNVPSKLRLANGREFAVPDNQARQLRDSAEKALARDRTATS